MINFYQWWATVWFICGKLTYVSLMKFISYSLSHLFFCFFFLTHLFIYLCLASEGVACRGDVIGCTVKFENDREENGKVEISFTLNGKRITQDKIEMEYSLMYSPSREMYPYICMGHSGMSVLAKVSICLDWERVSPQL